MGLTSDGSGLNLLQKNFNIKEDSPVIALAGNPNTGKSTVFNNLTGLKQHTGNWPGKTVTQAYGSFSYQEQEFTLVDLPGTYSLSANSEEERIARDFICFGRPDATIVVVDATNLERNLNLVLQVMEITDSVILCLNLMDEAQRKGIKIDVEGLEERLNIPVVPTIAVEEAGLEEIKETVFKIVSGSLDVNPDSIEYSPKVEGKIDEIIPKLKSVWNPLEREINFRWLALKLLEGDETILESLDRYYFSALEKSEKANSKSEVTADEVLRG